MVTKIRETTNIQVPQATGLLPCIITVFMPDSTARVPWSSLSPISFVIRKKGVLVITIGVTGHRVVAETEKISTGIDAAVDFIQNQFFDQPLVVMSQIAEGSDRLVAKSVLARPNSKLIVILPMSQSEYEADFKTAGSMSEFHDLLLAAAEVIELEKSEDRKTAYRTAGIYVLDHCDVLLSVWDGHRAQGAGGTGDIVLLARKRGVPVAWVHSGNRMAGTLTPTTLGRTQGKVTVENFPAYPDAMF